MVVCADDHDDNDDDVLGGFHFLKSQLAHLAQLIFLKSLSWRFSLFEKLILEVFIFLKCQS